MSKRQISIPLDIPDVEVLGVDIQTGQGIIITIESTLNTARCKQCGREISDFHGHSEWVQVRHLPILEQAVYVRYRPKRYRCAYCEGGPTTTQQVSWHEANSPNTRAFEDYLLKMLVNSTVQDVSQKVGLSYDRVLGVLERRMAQTVDWSRFERLDLLGIDEIALKKGHGDYAVIVSTRLAGGQVTVLGVLPDRQKATVEQFLVSIPDPLKATVHSVCVDMYEAYRLAVKAALPAAQVVIDRFHVVRQYSEAADKVRRREMARLKKTLPKTEYRALKEARRAFRTHAHQLDEPQRSVLERLFQHAPCLRMLYTFREGLFTIFEQATSQADAQTRLQRWIFLVREQHIVGFEPFLSTLQTYWEEITNFFVRRLTSGFVEGLNNKIRVLLRRAFGLFNLKHLFQRLSLDLEGYPGLA